MGERQSESQDLLQTVMDRIPDVTLLIDRAYRIVLANRAAWEVAGERDPVADRLTCHQFSHHSDIPCHGLAEPCPLAWVVSSKRPVTVKHIHYDADGNEALVEVSATPVFDEAGEVVQIMEACRQIVEPPTAGRSHIAKRRRAYTGLFQTAIDGMERALLQDALKATDGNKTAAAATLGMKPSTFRDKLTKHGLW